MDTEKIEEICHTLKYASSSLLVDRGLSPSKPDDNDLTLPYWLVCLRILREHVERLLLCAIVPLLFTCVSLSFHYLSHLPPCLSNFIISNSISLHV